MSTEALPKTPKAAQSDAQKMPKCIQNGTLGLRRVPGVFPEVSGVPTPGKRQQPQIEIDLLRSSRLPQALSFREKWRYSAGCVNSLLHIQPGGGNGMSACGFDPGGGQNFSVQGSPPRDNYDV